MDLYFTTLSDSEPVPGSGFTYATRPTNESAIEKMEKIIAQYREGLCTGHEAIYEITDVLEEHKVATKTSIADPSNPMWNCCKANPAKVMRFDDGSATVVCLSCSHTVGQSRIFDLPANWTPGPESD
ncbi:MAG: hypothetical protein ABWZ30_01090 [Jiangellaceae bacterium]